MIQIEGAKMAVTGAATKSLHKLLQKLFRPVELAQWLYDCWDPIFQDVASNIKFST
jgi:hypothetical protein